MRHIIITGASRGLGKQLALKLGKRNTKLYLISRNLKALQDISNEIENRGGQSQPIEFDLNNNIINIPDLLDYVVKDINFEKCESFILINNAGIIKPIDFIGEFSVNDIFTNLNTNCLSAIVLINEFVKKSVDLECLKKIINISSGVVFKPLGGWSLYSAAKSAVNSFLETLTLEQGNNIKTVSFDPGVMDTDIQEYIRKVNRNKFPFVDKFIEYYNKGILASADVVANKINEIYVDNWMAKNVFEKIKDYE